MKYFFLGCIFFVIESQVVTAQVSNQLWSELGVSGKLSEKVSYGADFSFRQSIYRTETFFPQVTIKYGLLECLKPSVSYLFIQNHSGNGFNASHRINFNVDYKQKLNRFKVGLRLRYQLNFSGFNGGYDPEFDKTIRFRASSTYDIPHSKINPLIWGELFYDPTNWYYGRQVSKFRFFLGFNYRPTKQWSLSCGYLRDERINQPNPQFRNVLQLGLTYSLNKED